MTYKHGGLFMKKFLKRILLTGFILMPFIFASCATTGTESAVEKISADVKAPMSNCVEIKEDTDYLHTDIVYPVFEEQELTRTIKNTVEGGLEVF